MRHTLLGLVAIVAVVILVSLVATQYARNRATEST